MWRQETALPLEDLGAKVVADLEYTFEYAPGGYNEIISAVGAGVDGVPEKVDHEGVKLIHAAQERSVRRSIFSPLSTGDADKCWVRSNLVRG